MLKFGRDGTRAINSYHGSRGYIRKGLGKMAKGRKSLWSNPLRVSLPYLIRFRISTSYVIRNLYFVKVCQTGLGNEHV